jgi:hypothetical protein
VGHSGGLLIGFCDNIVMVQGVSIGSFLITIFLKNISDDFVSALTNVYGPVLSNLKSSF